MKREVAISEIEYKGLTARSDAWYKVHQTCVELGLHSDEIKALTRGMNGQDTVCTFIRFLKESADAGQ